MTIISNGTSAQVIGNIVSERPPSLTEQLLRLNDEFKTRRQLDWDEKEFLTFADKNPESGLSISNYKGFLTPEVIKQEHGDYIKEVLRENPTAKLVAVDAKELMEEYKYSPQLETVRQEITPNDAFRLSGEQDVHEYFDHTVLCDSVLEGNELMTTQEEIQRHETNAVKFSQFNDRVILHVMEQTDQEVVSLVGMSRGGLLYAVVK